MTGKLTGKVSLVTGGASGLGRATAVRFAAEGSRVAVSDINPVGGEETVKAIRAAGGDAFFVRADVTKEPEVKAAVDATLKRYGRLDVLAACAGIAHDLKPMAEFSVEEWERVFAVNVRGVFLSAKHSITPMVKQGGGNIVVIVSDSAFVAGEGQAPYCASKGAALMLVRALSVDYGKHGIRVNCVCPSIADTPLVRDTVRAKPGEDLRQYGIEQYNTPEQIAGHMLFLACDDSANMNGQSIVVDFGGLAKSTFPF